MPWVPQAWPIIQAVHYGPRFRIDPVFLIIHSGDKRANVAEYFSVATRQASTHLAWSATYEQFAQCVPLSHVAWGAAGAVYKGLNDLNFRSIQVELPGPWDHPRNDGQLKHLHTVAKTLKLMIPSLRIALRHSDVEADRKDPGPGFKWECLDGLGYEMPFREAA